MWNRKYSLALIAVIFLVGAFVIIQRNGSNTVASPSPSSVSAPSYTMAQIATHNTKADCWTAISGSVYDLTPWESKHPGGEQAIFSLCGIDGTSAFENKHDSQQKPNQTLVSYKIGTLIK